MEQTPVTSAGTQVPALALLGATILAAAAAAWVAWELVRLAKPRRPRPGQQGDQTRQDPKQLHLLYRWFEPAVQGLAAWNRKHWAMKVEYVQHLLDLVQPGAWMAEEYLALKQLEAACIGLGAVVLIGLLFGRGFGVAAGLAALAGFPFLAVGELAKQADKRLHRIRMRLAYVVDLMALMVESGADFHQCLETTVAENEDHPLGEELGRVRASMDQGVPRTTALREMARRLDDHDVNEFVTMLNTSEDLGTPLQQALRTMAERLAGQHVQLLEQAGQKAAVHITWPGIVIMIACLLIVAVPLILSALGH